MRLVGCVISGPSLTSNLIRDAYLAQTHLVGWEQFCRGRISSLWGQAYQASTDDTSEGTKLWLCDVIHICLEYSLAAWDHRTKSLEGVRTIREQYLRVVLMAPTCLLVINWLMLLSIVRLCPDASAFI